MHRCDAAHRSQTMEGVKGTLSKNDGVVTDGGPNKDRGEDKDRLVGKGA